MNYDIAIIGAGFYGIRLALFLANKNLRVIVLEQESDICTHASYRNQARVHNGYHYPRNYTTLASSHKNYSRFLSDYKDCTNYNYKSVYGIAKNSYVNAFQFEDICERFQLPCEEVSNSFMSQLNYDLIEKAYLTEETVFDMNKVKAKLNEEIKTKNIDLRLSSKVDRLSVADNGVELRFGEENIYAKKVLNITYAGINRILSQSGFDLLDFKLELTETCLVQQVSELDNYGFTLMDGPFFSIIPFPAENCFSLTHVRYTPHFEWYEKKLALDPYQVLDKAHKSKFVFMQRDASRYIPKLKGLKYIKSLYEIKTIPTRNEADDGRPIVFKQHNDNFISILGSKIDNIYDIEEKIGEII